MRENLSAGREFACTTDLRPVVQSASEIGYDFITTYVSHPLCCLDSKDLPETLPTIAAPDLMLTSNEWGRLVVGKISPWIDVDSNDAKIRKLSEQALRSELAYYTYLSLPAILIELKSSKNENLARLINEHFEMNLSSNVLVWVKVPIYVSSAPAVLSGDVHVTNGYGDAVEGGGPPPENGSPLNRSFSDSEEDPWQWFYAIRTLCDNKPRLGLVLEITADLPDDLSKVTRWLGEPLRAYSLNTSVFLTNERNFPVLTRNHQVLIKQLHSLNIQCVVTGPTLHHRPAQGQVPSVPGRPPPSNEEQQRVASKQCLYYSYLNHLYKNRPQLDPVAEWAVGYEDTLQIPLQPLGDNLESQIYETFEKDPVKYSDYQSAISQALDVKKDNAAIPECSYELYMSEGCEDRLYVPAAPLTDTLPYMIYEEYQTDNRKYKQYYHAIFSCLAWWAWRQLVGVPVIMVLGAGRGPLMTAVIEATRNLNIKAKLFAVEKNPNAVVTLNHLAETKWREKNVTVVYSDIRDFQPAEEDKADIIVSELLGSFGDNELSPECLDGALHLIKPDCICIPQSYSSFIAPVHSPRLSQTVKAQAEKEPNPLNAYENSYVVRVHNHYLPAEPQELFTFKHPNFARTSNDRFKTLTFVAKDDCDVAGFVGFFTAYLYDRVKLSILPGQLHTPGLFSWFPIFFPLKHSIYVKKNEKITLNFWRCSDVRQVWYEWCVTSPVKTPVMNSNGRAHAIRKF